MKNELIDIWNLFIDDVFKYKQLKDLYKKLENKSATYKEAQILSSSLSNYFVMWLSKEYPSDSSKVLEALKDSDISKNFFKEIDDYVYSVQETINKSINIGLSPVKPSLKTKLINEDILATDNYERDIDKYTNALELSANKRVDTIQQLNAKFQNKAGFNITVSRKYDGKGLSDGRTCKWCLERVGNNVPYKQAVSKGMFQRHEGCHCMIEYNNDGNKTRQYSKGNRYSWYKANEINDSVEKLNKESYNKRARYRSNSLSINDKTNHAKQRSKERNIDDRAIEYAKKNAIYVSKIYYNDDGKPTQNYIGFKITTIANPETNEVITTYRTPASIRKKYKKTK